MAQLILIPDVDELDFPESVSSTRHYSVKSLLRTHGPTTDWESHYRIHGGSSVSSGKLPTLGINLPFLTIGSDEPVPSGSGWYPSNVRGTHSSSQGVWYPDDLSPQMYLSVRSTRRKRARDQQNENNRSFLNPFCEPPEHVIQFKFLHKLPSDRKEIQWALAEPEQTECRENEPMVLQSDKPTWLRRNEYITFCSMRSNPYLQLRRVCACLQDHSLPLEEDCVTPLLLQTLYQVGKFSEGEQTVILEWWGDKDKCNGCYELCVVLDKIVDEMRFKSRNHKAIPVLVLMTKYGSQWANNGDAVLTKLAEITKAWGDRLEDEESASNCQTVWDVRVRRSIFYTYSILCLCCHGQLSKDNIQQLLEMILIADKFSLNSTNKNDYANRIRTLTQTFLVTQLAVLIDEIIARPYILTAALKKVFASAPNNLNWTQISRSRGPNLVGFQAISSDGSEFAINIVTGGFLYNELPVGRLPANVVHNPLFQRSFGDRNFDVVTEKNGNMKTTTKIDGRFYEFSIDSSRNTTIWEDEDGSMKHALMLLDGTSEKVTTWGRDLPRQLREDFSHWHCPSHSCIFLRPIAFCDRTTQYLLVKCQAKPEYLFETDDETDKEKFGDVSEWSCYRIPPSLAFVCDELEALNFNHIESLVGIANLGTSNVFEILERIEPDQESIHVLVKDERTIFELTRFSLHFQLLSNNELICQTFEGWKVCSHQQLEVTLIDFSQYLILEHDGQKMMIIPQGQVSTEEDERSVKIVLPEKKQQDIYVYDIHSRFETIRARSGASAIEARLQLAALYAATGSLAPEPVSQCTGLEMACDLVRQSWVNRPLHENEMRHLKSIIKLACDKTVLSLLCYKLYESS